MGPDWLDFLLRALAVFAMGYGAYQGIQRMRENDTWSGAAYTLTVALQLVYVCGGMLIVLVYGVTLAWDYLVAFLITAGVYFAGGFYVCWKLVARIKARFPPKGKDPKSGGAGSVV